MDADPFKDEFDVVQPPDSLRSFGIGNGYFTRLMCPGSRGCKIPTTSTKNRLSSMVGPETWHYQGRNMTELKAKLHHLEELVVNGKAAKTNPLAAAASVTVAGASFVAPHRGAGPRRATSLRGPTGQDHRGAPTGGRPSRKRSTGDDDGADRHGRDEDEDEDGENDVDRRRHDDEDDFPVFYTDERKTEKRIEARTKERVSGGRRTSAHRQEEASAQNKLFYVEEQQDQDHDRHGHRQVFPPPPTTKMSSSSSASLLQGDAILPSTSRSTSGVQKYQRWGQ